MADYYAKYEQSFVNVKSASIEKVVYIQGASFPCANQAGRNWLDGILTSHLSFDGSKGDVVFTACKVKNSVELRSVGGCKHSFGWKCSPDGGSLNGHNSDGLTVKQPGAQSFDSVSRVTWPLCDARSTGQLP